MPKSYKAEMKVGGEWGSNSLRFATEAEAGASGAELEGRWMATSGHRAVPTEDPITARFENGRNIHLTAAEIAAANSIHPTHAQEIEEQRLAAA